MVARAVTIAREDAQRGRRDRRTTRKSLRRRAATRRPISLANEILHWRGAIQPRNQSSVICSPVGFRRISRPVMLIAASKASAYFLSCGVFGRLPPPEWCARRLTVMVTMCVADPAVHYSEIYRRIFPSRVINILCSTHACSGSSAHSAERRTPSQSHPCCREPW